jgi:hypothetical protein
LIAMSLRHLLCVPFLLLPAIPAGAAPAMVDTLAVLEQRVAIAADGGAVVTTTAVLARGGAGELHLPFGFEGADSFRLAGRDAAFPRDTAGAPAPLHRAADRVQLAVLVGSAAAAGDTVVVGCHVPAFMDWAGARGEFAAYDVAGTLANDADLDIGTCRLVLEMPPGYQVRRIGTTEPGFKPTSSPVPPYVVGRRGDRGFAAVTAKRLRPGGRVRLALQAEQARRGPVPLVAGALLGLLYLWFFRDVLPSRRAAAPPAPASSGGR